ncbi:N-acetylmuramoyl-L-alanine amidase [bacterium]|nr:N-acetylmuramoyl-L-alanine amidase [bacterium]
MKILLSLFFILLSCQSVWALNIYYPKSEKVTVNSPTSFFVGSADTDTELIINDEVVPVHKSGGFAHFVKLNCGENVFEIRSGEETLKYVINSCYKKPAPVSTTSVSAAPSQPKIKEFDCQKIFLTKDKRTVIRRTPSTFGFNRVTQLGENIPLYSDGEYGKFYRVNFSKNENYWVLKSDVKKDLHEISDGAVIISKDFTEDNEFLTYKYKFVGKSPYILTENSDKNYEYGLGLNFYNLLTKPDLSTAIYFPLQSALFGYSAEYSGDNFILKIRKAPNINKLKPLKNITITVDAGHGGSENGAIGCLGDKEKDINLDVAIKLQKELKKRGANVIMTRDEDVKIGLYDRVDITNNSNSSIFVSIHANALPDTMNPLTHRGTSVFYYYPQSKALAENILKSVTENVKTNNDGLRQGNYAVIRNTYALSVLVELAYMINPEDNALLIDEEFRKKCAQAIATGIENYLRSLI